MKRIPFAKIGCWIAALSLILAWPGGESAKVCADPPPAGGAGGEGADEDGGRAGDGAGGDEDLPPPTSGELYILVDHASPYFRKGAIGLLKVNPLTSEWAEEPPVGGTGADGGDPDVDAGGGAPAVPAGDSPQYVLDEGGGRRRIFENPNGTDYVAQEPPGGAGDAGGEGADEDEGEPAPDERTSPPPGEPPPYVPPPVEDEPPQPPEDLLISNLIPLPTPEPGGGEEPPGGAGDAGGDGADEGGEGSEPPPSNIEIDNTAPIIRPLTPIGHEIWGDYFYVGTSPFFGIGETLVHVEATPPAGGAGDAGGEGADGDEGKPAPDERTSPPPGEPPPYVPPPDEEPTEPPDESPIYSNLLPLPTPEPGGGEEPPGGAGDAGGEGTDGDIPPPDTSGELNITIDHALPYFRRGALGMLLITGTGPSGGAGDAGGEGNDEGGGPGEDMGDLLISNLIPLPTPDPGGQGGAGADGGEGAGESDGDGFASEGGSIFWNNPNSGPTEIPPPLPVGSAGGSTGGAGVDEDGDGSGGGKGDQKGALTPGPDISFPPTGPLPPTGHEPAHLQQGQPGAGTIPIEIIQMDLTGSSPPLGPVRVKTSGPIQNFTHRGPDAAGRSLGGPRISGSMPPRSSPPPGEPPPYVPPPYYPVRSGGILVYSNDRDERIVGYADGHAADIDDFPVLFPKGPPGGAGADGGEGADEREPPPVSSPERAREKIEHEEYLKQKTEELEKLREKSPARDIKKILLVQPAGTQFNPPAPITIPNLSRDLQADLFFGSGLESLLPPTAGEAGGAEMGFGVPGGQVAGPNLDPQLDTGSALLDGASSVALLGAAGVGGGGQPPNPPLVAFHNNLHANQQAALDSFQTNQAAADAASHAQQAADLAAFQGGQNTVHDNLHTQMGNAHTVFHNVFAGNPGFGAQHGQFHALEGQVHGNSHAQQAADLNAFQGGQQAAENTLHAQQNADLAAFQGGQDVDHTNFHNANPGV